MIITRQIRNAQELRMALTIVHNSYVKKGYMAYNSIGLRWCVNHSLASTQTFVSIIDNEIIATVSFFPDSVSLLPMDGLYNTELNILRSKGHIAEVGMLADVYDSFTQSFTILLELMKQIYWAGMNIGITDLIITVNPRHKAFYTKMLCFEVFGPIRRYMAVSGALALPMRMRIDVLTESDFKRERARKCFFSPFPVGKEYQGSYRITPEDLIDFPLV